MHVDRGVKRTIFMRRRIPEYWILDGDRRVVERWHPGETEPEVLDALLEWQPRPDIAPLRIDIAHLLR
jgi:Uma2 family endonuclease